MANNAKSIVFVDAGIEAPLQLASGIGFDAEIVILSPSTDGVAQITAALKSHPDAVEMLIVAHGAPGQLSLGTGKLSLSTLPQYRDCLQQWTVQTQITEISFYGCRVAAGDAGAEFLAAVRSLTQANIAASTHLLGHADKGGDWTLDAFWGEVTRRSLLTPEAIASYPGVLPSANDNIENAAALTPNTPATGDNSGATAQSGEPFHDPTLATADSGFQTLANDSLWWSWTSNVDGLVNVNTAGSSIDTVLAVYSGPSGATAADFAGFSLIERNDNAAPGETTSSITFSAVNGVTYYFAVDGVGLQQTTGNGITITLDTPPIITPGQLFTVPEDGSTAPSDGVDSIVNASGTPTTWAITGGNLDTDGDNIKAFDINPATGALSVTDADELNFEGGTTNYELTVEATDASGFSDTESVFVQVTNVNEAPTIVSISAPSTTEEGTSITLTGQIFDPDNGDTQTVTVNWGDSTTTTIDSGSLVDIDGNGNKSFTVTHTYTDDESLTGQIEVSVTDAGALSDGPVTRAISVLNVAPEIDPAGPLNFEIPEDGSKSFFLNATDASSADTFIWSVGAPTNGGTVNNPANPAAASQLFTYTPAADFAGTDTFQIQVTDDDGGTDTIDVTVTVTEQPDSPTAFNVNASADTIDEGESITLSGNFIDPDMGDSFTVTINWGDGTANTVLTNDDLAFNSSTNTYSFNNVQHQFLSNGSTTVFVTVEDASGRTATDSAVITINNVAPTLDPGSTFITIDEDTPGSLVFEASDAGDDAFTWSVKTDGSNGTAALVSPDTDGTQEFSYTPDADFSGADNFVVQVQDADGGTSSANVTVLINPVNDDPTNLNVTVTPATALNEGSEVTLSGTFDDVDNSTEAFLDDVHSITVDWGDGTSDIFTEADAGIFLNTDQTTVSFQDLKHTYSDEGDGSYTVTVTVEDAAGETVSTTREIQVLNVDPVVSPAPDSTADPLTTDEDTPVNFTVTATDVGVDDILTWSEITAPANGFLTPGTSTSNGVQNFTYTPNLNFEGTDTFTLQVADGDGGFAEKTYTVNVTGQNDAPTIIVNNFNIVEDEALPITLSVLDAQDLDEAGGDAAIQFTITGAAAGSFLVDSGAGPVANNVFTRQDIIDGKVSFLYENKTDTDPTFTIKVEDSAAAFNTASADIKSFQSIDDLPVFVDQDTGTAGTQLGTFTVPEGASVLITNSVIQATDEETTSRDLSFEVSKVEGGQFLLNGSGTTTFTQGDIDDGRVRFENDDTETAPSYEITVTDSGGNEASLNGTGTVAVVNDDPEITKNEFIVTEGVPLTVTSSVLNASDAETLDSSKIKFTISGTDSASFSATTFTLQDVFAGSVTFLYEENDAPVFDITVEDEQGKSVTETGNVIFTNTNDAPEFATGPVTFDVTEGGSTFITSTVLEAQDEESGPADLTFEVSNVLGGNFIVGGEVKTTFTQAQINANGVLFQHDGSETAPSYSITIKDGEDLESETKTGAGNIATPVNDLPTLDVNNFNVTEGVEFTVDTTVLNASDIETTDSAQITFTISGADANSFSLNGTPSTTFTLQDVFTGSVSFLYEGNDEPEFDIKVTDSDGGSITEAGNVTFQNVNDAPEFATGPVTFDVAEGGIVQISNAIIEASDEESGPADLTFTVSDVLGGDFIVGGQVTTEFTQQQINNNAVIFRHDGSETTPSYFIQIKDGGDLTSDKVTGAGNINLSVNDLPTLDVNNFNVTEGVEFTVDTDVLNASDIETVDSTQITFTISGADASSFSLNGTPSTTFTLQDVFTGSVSFFYEGNDEPEFDIKVTDSDGGSITEAGNVTFQSVNDAPEFATGPVTFDVAEGGIAPINATILAASDEESGAADLTFIVTDLAGGDFIVGGAVKTEFTQAQINANAVSFRHDGSETAPSYSIQIKDGDGLTSETVTGTGNINIPVNDAPIISVNNFNVTEGVEFDVTSAILDATDIDSTTEILFTISGRDADSFRLDDAPSTTFTRQNILEGRVSFLYTGDTEPVFTITANDQDPNTAGGATASEAGNIETFTSVNDTPVFLRPDGLGGFEVVTDGILPTFEVDENGNVPISADIIRATDGDGDDRDLTFTVSNVNGGNFFVVGGDNPATSFTQNDVNLGRVFFANDTTETPPSYTIVVADSEDETLTSTATGSGTVDDINDRPVFAVNNFNVVEGVSLPVDISVLNVTDEETVNSAAIVFTISGADKDSFLINNGAGPVALTGDQFTLQDIFEGKISFLHEGETSPVFDITVADDGANTGNVASRTVAGNVATFTEQNDAPAFVDQDGVTAGIQLGPINLIEDGQVQITSGIIAAIDPDNNDSELTFTVEGVNPGDDIAGGFFTVQGSETNTFTQADIAAGTVFFKSDGTEDNPSYKITVSDGELTAEAIGSGTVTPNDDAPTLEANNFDITEGVELTITTDILDAQDIDTDNANIQFTIGGADSGSFLLNGTPNITFSRQDILDGNVTFLYEGQAEPAFTITVTDGTTTLPAVDGDVEFTTVNDAPELTITTPIAITEDAAINITTTLFDVTDEEVDGGFQPSSDLVYTVDAVDNGKFLLNELETTSFTQAQIAAGQVKFQHEGETAPSFTVTLTDNGSPTPETVTKTITTADFTFTASNDVPVLGDNPNLTVEEGGTVTLNTSNLSATDVETNALDLTFTVSNVQNGEFKVNNVANTSFTLLDIIQDAVTFTHDDTGETPTDNKAPSFDVKVTDIGTDAGPALGNASSPVTPVTVTFNEVDDAPVLTPDGDTPGNAANDPFAITEGGILVLNNGGGFPGIQVTDPDTPPEEITIEVSNLFGGFFANVSNTETAISSFTLAELNSQQIVFSHDGSESQPSFTLGVKDNAADIVNDDEQNYTATLTTVNDEPEITLNQLTLTEGDVVTLTTDDLRVTDQETGPASLTYTISNLTNGDFYDVADTTFTTPLISFTQQQVIDEQIVFKHNESNDAPTYTLTATDDGTGGAAAASSDPSDAVIAFTPTNDAPEDNSATNGEFAITQGGTFDITTTQLSFTDEETTNPALLVYTVDEANTSRGQFLVDGEVATSFTQQDINLGRVSFEHDGSEFAPNYTVVVSDSGVPAPVKSTTLAVDLAGSFVNANNAPEISNNTLDIAEGQTIEFTTSILSATDSETPNLDLVFTISDIKNGKFTIADNPATTGVDESDTFGEDPFTAGNTVVAAGTASETFTLRDVVEGRVSFSHDGFDEAPEYFVSVTDTETSIGAADEITTGPVKATIAFTRDNDDPTLISDTANADLGLAAFDFTISEGAISSIGLTQIDAADEAGETAQIDLTFTVAPPDGATAIGGGFFARASDTAAAITSFTWVEVNNGDIVFKHDGSNVPPTYQLTVTDSEGGSSTETFTATLVEVNDAPTVTTNALALTEDDDTTIDASILTVTDEESAPVDLEYTVTAATGGEFQLNGATLTPGAGTFTQADVIAGDVTFVDDGNDDAPPTFSLTLTDGGIEDPGNPGSFINQKITTLTDADFAVAGNFTAVNDVPFTNNGANTPDEFIVLPFPGITEGQSVNVTTAVIDMSDEESSDAELRYIVDSIENATFQVNGADVNSFTQAEIDSGSVTLKHDGSEEAPTFTLTLKDNNGADGANQLTQSVTPDFTLANEAPEFTANTLSPIEGDKITLTTENLAASDREDLPTQLTFQITDVVGGTFFLNDNPLVTTDLATATEFSILQVAAGALTFQDDGDEALPSYNVTVTDADTGMPLDLTEAATIDDSRFAVNDAPSIDTTDFPIKEGELLELTTTNLSSSDDDNTDDELTYTVSDVVGGSFLRFNTATLQFETVESFTQQDVIDDLVGFQHDDSDTVPSFKITVSDGENSTTPVAIADGNGITFTTVNDAPIAVNDSFTTDEDTPLSNLTVAANDTDDSGLALQVTDVDGSGTSTILPSGANVSIVGNAINYDPGTAFQSLAAGETTTDTFTYTVNDQDPDLASGKTAVGTVTITIEGVNDNPATVTDTANAFENSAINIPVLDNDSDPDTSDMLSISAVGTTGTVGVVTTDGNLISYDPTGKFQLADGVTQIDTFSYTVSDGNGGTSTNTVTVTVTGVNDFPTAVDDNGAGFETDDNTSVTTPILIDNDDDPDNDPLNIIKINDAAASSGATIQLDGGAGGEVTLNANNSVTYTPPAAYQSLSAGATQNQTFTYTVDDGNGGTDTATVTIVVNGVNEDPVIGTDPLAYTVTEGDSINLPVFIDGNITDIDAKDILSISNVNTVGLTGTVVNNGTSLTYTPDQDLKGGETDTESFTYTVSDGNGGTATGTIDITVNGINNPPIANADSGGGFTTNEVTAFTTSSVLANDSDPEGATVSLVSINTSGTLGLVTNNGNGTFTYDPNSRFDTLPVGKTTTDTFSYTVQDDLGATATATVSITIQGLQNSYFDFEQFLQYQNPAAAIPTDTIDGFPLAQIYDEAFYLSRNPDVAALVGSVFNSGYEHFITDGLNEGRSFSALYNEAFYLSQNPDVANAVNSGAFTSGLQHFLTVGHRDGRDPSILFDQSDYLTNNPDIAAAVSDGSVASGFQHYVLSGVDEQRQPNRALFNEGFYLANNPDVAAAGIDPYAHFVTAGQFEGRRPSSLYRESDYLANNPDIANAVNAGTFQTGFEHYQQFGRFEGRIVF